MFSSSFILLLNFSQIITLFILLLFFTVVTLSYIGKKRNYELSNIKLIINGIRNNRFKSPEEIKLEKQLVELEGEIKSMFLRTQNDIANLKKLERA